MYGVGFALAAMVCGALGGSLASEHGWTRVGPIAVVATIVLGGVLGWAINGWIAYSQASAFH
jgi:ABC-type xylose transport system permease subunit